MNENVVKWLIHWVHFHWVRERIKKNWVQVEGKRKILKKKFFIDFSLSLILIITKSFYYFHFELTLNYIHAVCTSKANFLTFQKSTMRFSFTTTTTLTPLLNKEKEIFTINIIFSCTHCRNAWYASKFCVLKSW